MNDHKSPDEAVNPTPDELPAEEALKQEQPAPVKLYYKPNRKDRRRAAAIARKAQKQRQK